MPEFIPAVLPTSIEDLEAKVAKIPAELNYIHLDVLENGYWSRINKDFEVHLMVPNPNEIFQLWVERGAKRVIVHEISKEMLAYRGEVELGLAFELSVPIESVLAQAEFADFVHVMAIAEIGAQGHPLDPRVFDRIKTLQDKFPNLPISVDGGITAQNYMKLIELGADRLVIGSHFDEVWSSLNSHGA